MNSGVYITKFIPRKPALYNFSNNIEWLIMSKALLMPVKILAELLSLLKAE